MPTATSTPQAPTDPIDILVPPPRAPWVRLLMAVALVGAVGVVGYAWHFGLLRPAPDCCGSSSSGAQIGMADQDNAVTVTAIFANSSEYAVSITGASAHLPGATVLSIAPFTGPGAFELPPENLGDFPHVVDGHSNVWLAVTFIPEQCTDDGGNWGSITLDLEVADSPWYPTLDRRYELPDPVVPSGPGQIGVMQPASLDGAFDGIDRPLAAACILLGR